MVFLGTGSPTTRAKLAVGGLTFALLCFAFQWWMLVPVEVEKYLTECRFTSETCKFFYFCLAFKCSSRAVDADGDDSFDHFRLLKKFKSFWHSWWVFHPPDHLGGNYNRDMLEFYSTRVIHLGFDGSSVYVVRISFCFSPCVGWSDCCRFYCLRDLLQSPISFGFGLAFHALMILRFCFDCHFGWISFICCGLTLIASPEQIRTFEIIAVNLFTFIIPPVVLLFYCFDSQSGKTFLFI